MASREPAVARRTSRRRGGWRPWRMIRAGRRTRRRHGVQGAGVCAPEEQREAGSRPLADEVPPAGPVGCAPEEPSVGGFAAVGSLRRRCGVAMASSLAGRGRSRSGGHGGPALASGCPTFASIDSHGTKVVASVDTMPARHKWVMMNKITRKLARIPDEVQTEIDPYFFQHSAIEDEDSRKLPKLSEHEHVTSAKYVRTGLTPRWADLDINQHVNNVKYIGWILESAPISILENHELAGMVLDYKRECGRDNILESHTAVYTDCTKESGETTLHCEHLLRLESGHIIVKARTMWRPKGTKCQETVALSW